MVGKYDSMIYWSFIITANTICWITTSTEGCFMHEHVYYKLNNKNSNYCSCVYLVEHFLCVPWTTRNPTLALILWPNEVLSDFTRTVDRYPFPLKMLLPEHVSPLIANGNHQLVQANIQSIIHMHKVNHIMCLK